MTQISFAMFPGQGSQNVGMGQDLAKSFKVAQNTFVEASDILGIDIAKLCWQGPADKLMLTANTQPAILTTSIAFWRVLRSETSWLPELMAGHSLGEYSALVAANKLEFKDALRLVRMRGEAMQSAVPEGVGAMAAVMRCDFAIVHEACQKIREETGNIVQPANLNSQQQIVVAGHKEAVTALINVLQPLKAICKLLPVSAPFHCELMMPAQTLMAEQIKTVEFNDTDSKIIANVSGEIEHPYERDLLIDQITKTVRWNQSTDTAINYGCRLFVEVGPSAVLSGLAKRSYPNIEVENCSDFSKLLERLQSSKN